MKRFLAIYTGSQEALAHWRQLDDATRRSRESKGMEAWMQWGRDHEDAILDQGAPLGKTKRIAASGITDVSNQMTGYVIVQAESHEDAARLFLDHPHFKLFPGDGVEIMECLPIPTR